MNEPVCLVKVRVGRVRARPDVMQSQYRHGPGAFFAKIGETGKLSPWIEGVFRLSLTHMPSAQTWRSEASATRTRPGPFFPQRPWSRQALLVFTLLAVLEMGPARFLAKPYRLDELAGEIKLLLGPSSNAQTT